MQNEYQDSTTHVNPFTGGAGHGDGGQPPLLPNSYSQPAQNFNPTGVQQSNPAHHHHPPTLDDPGQDMNAPYQDSAAPPPPLPPRTDDDQHQVGETDIYHGHQSRPQAMSGIATESGGGGGIGGYGTTTSSKDLPPPTHPQTGGGGHGASVPLSTATDTTFHPGSHQPHHQTTTGLHPFAQTLVGQVERAAGTVLGNQELKLEGKEKMRDAERVNQSKKADTYESEAVRARERAGMYEQRAKDVTA